MASPHPPRQLLHPPSSPFGTPTGFAFPTAAPISFGGGGGSNHDGFAPIASSSSTSNIPFNLGAPNFASANPAGFGFGGAGGWGTNANAIAGRTISATPSVAKPTERATTDDSSARSSFSPAAPPASDQSYARKRRQSSSSSSAMADDTSESIESDRRAVVQRHMMSHGKRDRRQVNADDATREARLRDDDASRRTTAERSGKRARSEEIDEHDDTLPDPAAGGSSVTQKRLRFEAANGSRVAAVNDETSAEARADDDVDLGVLLASLPPVTHLQLLHSLVRERPSLRPLLISLLPPPELEYCMVNLEEKYGRVVEAVPVGANGSSTSGPTGTTIGSRLTTTPSSARAAPASGGQAMVGRIGFGFGFGSGRPAVTTVVDQTSLISDGYVLNRLRGPVHDLCSTATTYLPYFLPGGKPASTTDAGHTSSRLPSTPPHASVSFQYLHFLSDLLVTRLLPLLPEASPAPAPVASLLEDVLAGWRRWIDALSEHVNKAAGMYPASTVEGWHRTLEHLAQHDKVAHLGDRHLSQSPVALATKFTDGVRQVKDRWVREVGWLIGLHTVVDMDS